MHVHLHRSVLLLVFFDVNTVVTKQALLNMVVSERGAGKSYGTLKFCLQQFLKGRGQFVYIRRTEKELAKARDSIFTALEQDEFQRGDFTTHGGKVIYHKGKKDEKVAGYCMALNLSTQYKSTAYPQVSNIIFEEFIEERDRYLANEVERFLSLCETILRLRDRGTRIFMLGNLYTVYNPYFNHFNLFPNGDDAFTFNPSKTALIYNFKSPAFREEKAKTRFAQLIQDSEVGQFILNNKAILDDDSLTIDGGESRTLLYRFTVDEGCFWVYMFGEEGRMYVTDKPNIGECPHYNLREIFMSDAQNLGRNNPVTRGIRRQAARGTLFFNSPRAKRAVENIFAVKR